MWNRGVILLLVWAWILPAHSEVPPKNCSTGWIVSGLYIPVEWGFAGSTMSIMVNGKPHSFIGPFLKEVRAVGVGVTSAGEYLTWQGIDYANLTDKWELQRTHPRFLGMFIRGAEETVSPFVVTTQPREDLHAVRVEGWDRDLAVINAPGLQKHLYIYFGVGVDALLSAGAVEKNNATVCFK